MDQIRFRNEMIKKTRLGPQDSSYNWVGIIMKDEAHNHNFNDNGKNKLEDKFKNMGILV